MSRWFRHYAGMMRDDKLVSVALRAKQPVERVLWVWGAILESAAEIDDEGRYDLDAAEVSYFLRADEADIYAILDGLATAKRVAKSRVVNWGSRQFQSDRSASRQAAYRERRRSDRSDGDNLKTSHDDQVTAESRHGDAPETETETETERKKEPGSLRSPGRTRQKSGTRLPEDWVPSEVDLAFAATLLPDERISLERDKFRDYWHARAGPGSIKRDWSGTWRNWCRNAVEYQGNGYEKHRNRSLADAADELIARAEREERTLDLGPGDYQDAGFEAGQGNRR